MLAYNGEIIKNIGIHTDTDDATLVASDLQAGVTAYAKGRKVTGTGKAFSFATYGGCSSNDMIPIPVSTINTVAISSSSYAVKMSDTILALRNLDFSTAQTVATVTIGGADYPITVKVTDNMITVSCSYGTNIALETLFGKDEYI